MSQALEQPLLQSAREASISNAWHDAFQLFKRAAENEPLAPEDLERLADAAWWTGRLEENLAARQEAYAGYLRNGQPRQAATNAVSLARDFMGKQAKSIASGWIKRAERLLADEPESREHGYLHVLKAFVASSSDDHEASMAHAAKALEIGTRFGDRNLQAYGLMFEGRVRVARGDVERGLALLDEATVAAVSGELGPEATGFIYCMAITATSTLRDYQRAGEWTEAAKRWCERQSISGFPGHCRVLRAEIMQLRGSWSEAEQDVRLALNELKDFNLNLAADALYELGEIRRRMGDLKAAEEAYRQAEELGFEPQPGKALLRLAGGDIDGAARGVKRALGEEGGGPLGRFPLLGAQVEIALAAGKVGLAEAASREMEEIASVYSTPALQAAAAYSTGGLQVARGEAGAAVETLHKALRLWKQAEVPYEVARTRLLLGEAYASAGDTDAAELELESAASGFRRLGAVLELRKAQSRMGTESKSRGSPSSRVTKTFLFTDIVKSTNLVEAMGDEAWGDLLEWHDRTLRSLFLTNGGEEVKHAGDGFFVAFDRPADAVRCAVAIQSTLAEHRRAHGFSPSLRIGIHCGEATLRGGDYEGAQVHLAARIGALAEGGEILVSSSSLSDVSGEFATAEPRTVSLKGVSRPVEIVPVAWRD